MFCIVEITSLEKKYKCLFSLNTYIINRHNLIGPPRNHNQYIYLFIVVHVFISNFVFLLFLFLFFFSFFFFHFFFHFNFKINKYTTNKHKTHINFISFINSEEKN